LNVIRKRAFAFAFSRRVLAQQNKSPVLLRIQPMFRVAISLAAVVLLIAMGTSAVLAKSSGEIALDSKLLAEKQEGCRLQAKQQHLGLLKRRSFMRDCMKSKS
jgi:hypothetical protein